MSLKSKKTLIFALFLLATAVGLTFGGMYDLQISTAIADPSRLWGRILEVAGEPPALLLTGYSCSLVMEYVLRFKDKHKAILAALAMLGLVISVVYPTFNTFEYLSTPKSISLLLTPIISMLLIVIVTIIHAKVSDEYIRKHYDAAITVIGAAITTLIVISLMKQIWGRVRFRQLDSAAELGRGFTPWYIPQFFTGYVSFPSGHTSNATVIFLLYLYFPKQKRWLCPALALWIILVAASRVFVGAHYLSDVVAGCAVTSLICFIWINRMRKMQSSRR